MGSLASSGRQVGVVKRPATRRLVRTAVESGPVEGLRQLAIDLARRLDEHPEDADASAVARELRMVLKELAATNGGPVSDGVDEVAAARRRRRAGRAG